MSVQIKGSGTIGGIDEGLVISGIITTTSFVEHAGDSNTKFGFEGPDTITFETAGSERLRITSNGSIVVGGDTPATVGQTQLTLRSNSQVGLSLLCGAIQNATITFGGLADGYSSGDSGYADGKIMYDNSNNHMQFDTAGDERLRIDSDGHLHIKGTDHELRFYRDAGDRYGAITYDGGQFNIKNPANDNTNVTKSDGTLHTRFNNNGDLQIANGNLVISTAGKGIDFSAAGNAGGMTSEVLDDYEEGSWTPYVTIETRPASDSPVDSVQGNYVKVGGLVHAFGQFALNGTPSERSTSRAIELRGFPFTHNYSYDKVGGDVRSSGHLINSTWGQDIYFVMRMINGAAYCRIEVIEQSHVGTRNASPVMTDNMYVIFSFTYSAA